MNAYGQYVVIDSGFETVLGDVSRAIREEGLQTIARIDVRDHFWRDLGPRSKHFGTISVLERFCQPRWRYTSSRTVRLPSW
jgi:hypothetical protein